MGYKELKKSIVDKNLLQVVSRNPLRYSLTETF